MDILNNNNKEILEGSFLHDPFREENAVFKHESNENKQKEGHYVLHVESENTAVNKEILVKEELLKKEKIPALINEKPKSSLKETAKDILRQITVGLAILVIGFFAINYSAYYQIVKNKWDTYLNKNVIEQQVNTVNDTKNKEALKSSEDPEVQKRQIPALNLEVAPIDNRIIIPKINQNIPIVRVSSKNLINKDWNALEKEMQDALKEGVVHYPGTSLPGQTGNAVITGHSSYFPWDPGRFKDVFALLHDVNEGDHIIIYYEQQKIEYEVVEKKEVQPDNIEVLKQTPDDRITLITCTPVGTNLRRLIVIAKPISGEVEKTEAVQ
ncbi:MAG: sortase [Candidatus Gracilibacteria bacterium]|jgi:LPXTG-site transpeptidase (sortase) family protein